MGFLDFLSPIVGGVSSVVGLIQDSQARQEALQQQQQALQAYGQAADQQYQNMLGNNSRTLYGMAGQGATALSNLGANMGSALAGAGVYNSSATAGGLAQAQANENTAIANLAAQNSYNANSFYNQAQQNLAQMRLGQANLNYGNANADLQGSRQGLGNFLGALSTSDLLGAGQGGGTQSYMPGVDLSQTSYDPVSQSSQPLPAPGAGALNFSTAYGGNGVLGGGPLGGTSSMQSMPPVGSPAAMGAMTQANLASSGANAYRTALPQIPGTLSQGANLGGNAGGLGGGGATNGSSFYSQPGYTGWSGLLDRSTTGMSGALSGR